MGIFGEIFHSGARTAESDSIAMDASDQEWPALCSKGNILACELAKLPVPSAEKEAAASAELDRQAQAERLHTAKKLDQVGQSRVATAVRQRHDVHYRADDSIERTTPSVSAGEVLTGIASILNPLAKNVGVYASSQQYASRRAAGRGAMPMRLPASAKKDNTAMIVGVIGGVTLITILLVVAIKK
jgi:hypothetical protein